MATLKRKRAQPGRYDVVRLWDGKEEPVGQIQRLGGVGVIETRWYWSLNPGVSYFGMFLGQKPYGNRRTLTEALDDMRGLVI